MVPMVLVRQCAGEAQLLAKVLPTHPPRPLRGYQQGPLPRESWSGLRGLQSTGDCRWRSMRAGATRRRAFERGRLAPQLRLRRAAVITGLILAYAWYYVCRYSLTYAGPSLVQRQGLDLRKLGLILSAGQITIGLSKVLTSVLTVDLPASWCLVLGLLLTGACNVLAACLPSLRLTLMLAVASRAVFDNTNPKLRPINPMSPKSP